MFQRISITPLALKSNYSVIPKAIIGKRNVETGACVYLAKYNLTGETVAVKEFNYMTVKTKNPIFTEWTEYRGFWEREYRVMKLIEENPHVLNAKEFIVDDEAKICFIIMPYFKNSITLADYWRMHWSNVGSCRVLNLRERYAVEIIRQVVSGLGTTLKHHNKIYSVASIHQLGFAHGDIKMENILVCPNENAPVVNESERSRLYRPGKKELKKSPAKKSWTAPTLKIIDFGTCFPASDEKGGYWAGRSGTHGYFSAEMLKKPLKPFPGKAGDIWALGVIVQYFTSLLVPFHSIGDLSKVDSNKVKRGDYNKTRWFSLDLHHFLKRVFQVDPMRRANIVELAAHPFLNIWKHESSWDCANKPLGRRRINGLNGHIVTDVYELIKFTTPKFLLNDISFSFDTFRLAFKESDYGFGEMTETDCKMTVETIFRKLQNFHQIESNFFVCPEISVFYFVHGKKDENRRSSLATINSTGK